MAPLPLLQPLIPLLPLLHKSGLSLTDMATECNEDTPGCQRPFHRCGMQRRRSRWPATSWRRSPRQRCSSSPPWQIKKEPWRPATSQRPCARAPPVWLCFTVGSAWPWRVVREPDAQVCGAGVRRRWGGCSSPGTPHHQDDRGDEVQHNKRIGVCTSCIKTCIPQPNLIIDFPAQLKFASGEIKVSSICFFFKKKHYLFDLENLKLKNTPPII